MVDNFFYSFVTIEIREIPSSHHSRGTSWESSEHMAHTYTHSSSHTHTHETIQNRSSIGVKESTEREVDWPIDANCIRFKITH